MKKLDKKLYTDHLRLESILRSYLFISSIIQGFFFYVFVAERNSLNESIVLMTS